MHRQLGVQTMTEREAAHLASLGRDSWQPGAPASGCRAWHAALLRAATHAVHMHSGHSAVHVHSGKRADRTGMAAGWSGGLLLLSRLAAAAALPFTGPPGPPPCPTGLHS